MNAFKGAATAPMLFVLSCSYPAECDKYDGRCNAAVTSLLFFRSPYGNPSATSPSSLTGVIYLFRSNATSNGILGGIGGRSGADTSCAGSRGLYTFPDNSCTSTRAFMSIDAADEIQDLGSNYGVPSTGPVQGPAGAGIAANLADLLDGTTSSSLSGAGVLAAATDYWTFSTATGALSANNCNNGFLTGLSGQVGNSSFSNGQWLDDGTALCLLGKYLICTCY